MKVLICDSTQGQYVEQMQEARLVVDVLDGITSEELIKILAAYDGVVVRSRTQVRQPLIDACPNLKVIVRGGVGLDNIDHEYAKSKGIVVMNTPLVSSGSVAELAIGSMFALARSTYQVTKAMKAERWDKKSFAGEEIGGKTLGQMKDGVRIIDCARGGIINENALYEALTQGKVASAALDVFAEEPPTDWKLLQLDNVIGSPHTGATTREAQARIGAEVALKLIEFAKTI